MLFSKAIIDLLNSYVMRYDLCVLAVVGPTKETRCRYNGAGWVVSSVLRLIVRCRYWAGTVE